MRMRGLAAGKEKMDAFWRCMEFLRSTPQKVFRVRRRSRRTRGSLKLTIHPLLCTNEKAPFKYAIQQLAIHHLTPQSTTTTEDKIEAIASIGHLSWTGGIEAAEYTAAKYIKLLVFLLKDPDSPHALKLQIIKSFSEICCGSMKNQNLARRHLLISTIIGYMRITEDDDETRKWSLHTLFYILCDNTENQLEALQNPDFKFSMLRGLSDNWGDWEYNEARELETMLSEVLKTFENTT